MKTKYKLIKEYPGSPCIGTIKEVETREGRVLTCNTWELYNIYPEFWEEVDEIPEYVKFRERIYKVKDWTPHVYCIINDDLQPFKSICAISTKEEYEAQFREYEILSFEGDTGKFATPCPDNFYRYTPYNNRDFTLSKMLELASVGTVRIHSVKRLSDGEIFTVGDKLHKHGATIKKFIVMNDFLQIISDATHGVVTNNLGWRLENLQKARCPLFITEDGIPIYVGDEYWLYDELTFNLIKGCAKWSSPTEYSHMKTIYFSTKQAAENYITKNKVVFVTEDGVDVYAGDTFYFVDYYFEIGRGKAISGTFSKLSNYKEFSTKEKAQEYIDMNKPMYSIKDVEQGLIRSGYHRSFIEVVLNKLRTFKK